MQRKCEKIARQRRLEASRRKRLVAEMMLAGLGRDLSSRQIAQALYEGGTLPNGQRDPKTTSRNEKGEAWSHTTIQADIQEIEDAWALACIEDLAKLKAEFFAMYRANYKRAWLNGDTTSTVKIIGAMREMMGTDSPSVTVYEQMQAQMLTVIRRLKVRFGDRPEILEEIIKTMSGDFDTMEAATTAKTARRGLSA